MESNKTVMISGIKGQLASYLADLYLAQNWRIIGFQRRSGMPDYCNIQHLLNNKSFILEDADITDLSSLSSLMEKYKPDHFINCAAQSFVFDSYNQPISTCEINFMGVLNCLEAIRQISPKTKFLNLSTSEVYGEVLETPQNENTKPNPVSPYAASKYASEIIIDTYRHTYKLWVGYSRVFNMESPRRSKQFVTRKITDWIGRSFAAVERHILEYMDGASTNIFISVENGFNNALETGLIKKLQLGNLDSRRDWQHCEDAAGGLMKVMELDDPELFVFGSGEMYSIKEFLEKAFAVIGVKNWQDYVESVEKFMRPSDVNVLLCNPTKAINKLGWTRKHNIDSLIKDMVENDIELNKQTLIQVPYR